MSININLLHFNKHCKMKMYRHRNTVFILITAVVIVFVFLRRNEVQYEPPFPAIEQKVSKIQDTADFIWNEPEPVTEKPEVALRFIVMGDWGGQEEYPYTTPVLLNLASALASFTERMDTKFILSLGDNFCDHGVTDVHDHRFKDTFEDVFQSHSLNRPWYIIAGNDDYRGNVSAEIEYTKLSRRWFFEREYYKLHYELPSFRNVTIEILMIDTVQLCGMAPEGSYIIEGPMDEMKAEKQWKWIEKQLRTSRAQFLMVAGHYPVLSAGRHGSTACLKDRLKPLLEKYKVSAYFSGHDHSVQHYKGKDTNNVDYFVTGATHPRDDAPAHLDGLVSSAQYFWTANSRDNVGAFTYCDVTKDLLSVAFVNSKQQIMYYAAIHPREMTDKKRGRTS